METFDYVVVGSGCAGAMAAQTLVEQGAKVTMFDVGITPETNPQIPNKDFITLRKTDKSQYRYFIGDKASGVGWGDVGKGEQITPPRKYIMDSVDKFIPVNSSSFSPLESLGYGGLGIGWGLQCWTYSEADLLQAGLNPDDTKRAYEVVSKRVGISATKDDAAQYTLGNLTTYQKSPRLDRNHRQIMNKYNTHKRKFHKKGLRMGRTPLALITEDFNGRKKYAYHDMDYYSDNGRSAWRPWVTIDELKKQPNFDYINSCLVLSFNEKKAYVEIHCLNTKTGAKVTFRCRKLVLAASALGSARIAARSLADANVRLPLLCNPYNYMVGLQPKFFGKPAEPGKLGFGQLSLFLDEDHKDSQASVASTYSYQSLMLFRLIRHTPFNFHDARILLQYLSSGMVIMGVHHPDEASRSKYISLDEDKLNITYNLSDAEKQLHKSRERKLVKAMRELGVYTIKKTNPGYGASVHYAGTLPFSNQIKPLTLSAKGRLHGTKNVYVADSSGFKFLPAKGLTFTLMANAHLVAESVLNNEQ